MKCRTSWCAISILVLAVSSANGRDSLELFDGMWLSVNPKPGEQYMFQRTPGGSRQATLPHLGPATLTPSNGEEGSNLKISGPDFECYYFFGQTGFNEMVWTLKSGAAVCPDSATLRKAQDYSTNPKQAPAKPPQASASTTPKQVPAKPPQASVATTPKQVPAKPPQASVATTAKQAPAKQPQASASTTPKQVPAKPPQASASTTPKQAQKLPKNPIVRQPVRAAAREKICTLAQGDHVVVGVDWNDPDGGLNLRSAPGGEVQGVIPPNGIGIGVSSCNNDWCYVKYGCQSGWAHSPSLSQRTDRLRRVTGVSANDPQGLKLRTGPGPHYAVQPGASIPYNAVGVIEHTCEADSNDTSDWCLVTYKNQSGWVSAGNLDIDIGTHSSATKATYSSTPLQAVFNDYRLRGYTESMFHSRHGNVWNLWTSKTSGNTLIWSKTSNGGRGEGFNCVADARPKFWGSCTRYDLRSGQVIEKSSVQIANGTLIDRPIDNGTVIDRSNPVLGHPVVRHPAAPLRPHPLHQM